MGFRYGVFELDLGALLLSHLLHDTIATFLPHLVARFADEQGEALDDGDQGHAGPQAADSADVGDERVHGHQGFFQYDRVRQLAEVDTVAVQDDFLAFDLAADLEVGDNRVVGQRVALAHAHGVDFGLKCKTRLEGSESEEEVPYQRTPLADTRAYRDDARPDLFDVAQALHSELFVVQVVAERRAVADFVRGDEDLLPGADPRRIHLGVDQLGVVDARVLVLALRCVQADESVHLGRYQNRTVVGDCHVGPDMQADTKVLGLAGRSWHIGVGQFRFELKRRTETREILHGVVLSTIPRGDLKRRDALAETASLTLPHCAAYLQVVTSAKVGEHPGAMLAAVEGLVREPTAFQKLIAFVGCVFHVPLDVPSVRIDAGIEVPMVQVLHGLVSLRLGVAFFVIRQDHEIPYELRHDLLVVPVDQDLIAGRPKHGLVDVGFIVLASVADGDVGEQHEVLFLFLDTGSRRIVEEEDADLIVVVDDAGEGSDHDHGPKHLSADRVRFGPVLQTVARDVSCDFGRVVVAALSAQIHANGY